MTIRRRRWLRKHPAPAPTPEGFVYVRAHGKLELVKAVELQNFLKQDMDRFDKLSPELRQEYRGRVDNIPVRPDDLERSKQNKAIAAFGIGRAG